MLASEKASDKPCFVDLDGDGFDDNTVSQSNTGLAKMAVADTAKAEPKSNLNGFFALSADLKPKIDLYLHKSDAFTRLKSTTTPLAKHRGGFGGNGGFGPDNTVGSGSVGGGACAGGCCRP